MGLLSMALGTSNPVAQFVDANKFAVHGAFSGLANGQNISQGLANAAQGAATGAQQDSAYGLSLADQQSRIGQIQFEQNLQTNALKLAAQGRTSMAGVLAQSPNPNVRAMAPLVLSGAMAPGDAFASMYKPGETIHQGDSLLAQPLSSDPNLAGQSPPAAASGSSPNASAPAPTPGAPPFVPASATATDTGQPIPLAPLRGTADPSIGASGAPPTTPAFAPSVPAPSTGVSVSGASPQMAPVSIKPVFSAPTGDPLKMTVPQRQDFATAQGMKPGDPGYANFVMTGKLPQNVTETWGPATAADLSAQGISSADPSLYQKSNLGKLEGISGAVSQGNNAPPLGTIGKSAIDPTVPGYTSKVVVAGLTQAAIDQKAIDYFTSGTEPPVGRTGLAGAQSSAISNRMAELAPAGNLAGNKAQLASLSDSLKVQQQYLDTTQRSVSNAENGFAQVVNTFQGKINTSQYPTLNAVKNAIAMHLQPGEVSAYQSGLAEVANEYTQVFSRGGQTTDAVRNKANDIVNGDLSIGDLGQVLKELQSQGGIVVKGAQTQVGRITDQINGIIGGKTPAPADDSAAPVTATNPQTGEKLMLQNGAWVPAQ